MDRNSYNRALYQQAILLCVPWGTQLVPAVHRECFVCHCELALAKTSVQAEQDLNLKPICVRCCIVVAMMKPEDTGFGGVIYDGHIITP